MAQYNSANGSFQTFNKTLFEVNQMASSDGVPTSNTNPFPVTGTTINPWGRQVLEIDDDTVQHTSRNRRKISNYEIIDYANFQYSKQSDVWDEEITGTASATWEQYMRMVLLSVGGSAGDQVIRQTKRVTRYTPGRMNEVSMSVIFGTPTTGIRRRFGLFDDAAGFYFEDGGDGNYYVVIRNTTSTGITETRVSRDNWNVDKLDGTGPSGITADPNAIQLMLIEYEWYGAGQVEFNFIINNNKFPVHQFNHANIATRPYVYTPFLPVRVELTNVTGAAGTHTMYQGSHSIIAEGDLSIIGRVNNLSSPVTGYTLTTANTFYPVLSIKLKDGRLRGVVIPAEYGGATFDNTDIFIRVIRNATITGGTWVGYDGDSSHVQYNMTATGITGGEVISTLYVSGGNQGALFTFDNNKTINQLARYTTTTLGDTSDTITIAIAALNSNKSGWATLNWIEVR